jgi:hypothetical protein
MSDTPTSTPTPKGQERAAELLRELRILHKQHVVGELDCKHFAAEVAAICDKSNEIPLPPDGLTRGNSFHVNAATENDLDLIGNPDALVWAKRFVQRVTDKPEIATDEGTMLAWFASAIMAGYDRNQSPPDGLSEAAKRLLAARDRKAYNPAEELHAARKLATTLQALNQEASDEQ